jgi:hypothetical protein
MDYPVNGFISYPFTWDCSFSDLRGAIRGRETPGFSLEEPGVCPYPRFSYS